MQFSLGPVARKKHPKILNGGSRDAIIEVDKMRRVVAPQNVAHVTIAVQSNTVLRRVVRHQATCAIH